MQGYDLYLFDVDDTLIQTFETVSSLHYRELSRQLGVPFPGVELIRQNWGGNLSESLKAIFGGQVDIGHAQAILTKLHKKSPVPPVEGVLRILEILGKHKKFIGLFSSSEPSLLDLGIHHSLGRTPGHFNFILSTTEQGIEKPSAHIVFMAMETYRQQVGTPVERERVLVVGDSLQDYETARNAGVDFAAVLSGVTTRQAFLDAGLGEEAIFDTIQHAMTAPKDHGIVAIIRDELGRILLIEEARPGHQYENHWSGPHGACEPQDIIEDETVVREVFEEVGLNIRPVKKLYTRVADTKVKTVSFWETDPINSQISHLNVSSREVGRLGWFDEQEILSGRIALYPGTYDFFAHYYASGGKQNAPTS